MLYKVLVITHLLGATIWIGGHIALVAVVLPGALKRKDPARIAEFERGYGRLGLAALVVQLATGLWLAGVWLGGWRNVISKPPPPALPLIGIKLVLLAATLGLAGHAHRRVLPGLDVESLPRFAIHAWATTVLAVLLLIVGASIRLGGLW